ncbi:response regulator transcription factor [Flavobacterium sp. CYK-4]|uniref:response regulator transcription factor n=1 Tax=Flavobacterium lotistagni TaxID=2709660 RepID=UPI00140D6A57|nr:response regulator transcription factor [Flavobacterium lotistagni]NHM05681.1 response regulator transcription factor [Flavobacterium lotistagni]
MIKIIIVDDHQMFLEGMSSVLSNEANIEVLFTENSARATLKKMKSELPDLIITDISMPDMNGIEFIKNLKNHFPEIKILVLSMYKSANHIDGIDGYLLKDTDKNELIEVINGIVLQGKKFLINPTSEEDFVFKRSILSQREKEIIQLIAQEFTTEEIAEKLFISKHTIESHRKNIFLKLQVKNIAGLIKKAIYLGVID